jgi:hypothetical protein
MPDPPKKRRPARILRVGSQGKRQIDQQQGQRFVKVTSTHLLELFNDAGIEAKAKSGEYSCIIVRNAHPSSPLANEPFCTRSQLLEYCETKRGEKVATAHRYLREDGTIGLSGHPDPKEVLVNGVLYCLDVA